MASIDVAIIKDGGAQMRTEMRPETILEYADDMLSGATFPPVVVYFDGANYWLGDGYHRVEAARKIERATIEADVKEGTQRDAILHGIGANANHGLRRTQADKRRAVERLLKDPEWAQWSDRRIAQLANVDHKTVGVIRRELTGEVPKGSAMASSSGNSPPLKTKANGRNSIMDSVLASLSDDQLIAECRRRGLTVAADV